MELQVPSNNFNRIYGENREFMISYKPGVHKAMGRPGVDEWREKRGDGGSCEGDMEGVRVGKSRRVETNDLSRSTRRINAVLSMCGGLRTA